MPQTPSEAEIPAREPRDRWGEDDAGRRYAGVRWKNARRAARDPRLVARLLGRHRALGARVLDAPCGTGRLRATLAGFAPLYVGLDVSAPMLREARRAGEARLVLADLARLPFADASFDVVVCCRILHHLVEPDAFDAALRELTRVSARFVVASFWDRASLPAVGRRIRRHKQGGRVAHTKQEVRDAFAAAGAAVIDYEHSFRFLSQQTFVLAEVR